MEPKKGNRKEGKLQEMADPSHRAVKSSIRLTKRILGSRVLIPPAHT
jgi:hypothetical protein